MSTLSDVLAVVVPAASGLIGAGLGYFAPRVGERAREERAESVAVRAEQRAWDDVRRRDELEQLRAAQDAFTAFANAVVMLQSSKAGQAHDAVIEYGTTLATVVTVQARILDQAVTDALGSAIGALMAEAQVGGEPSDSTQRSVLDLNEAMQRRARQIYNVVSDP